MHCYTTGADKATVDYVDHAGHDRRRRDRHLRGGRLPGTPARRHAGGGGAKLDIYLEDLGDDGLYGYCTSDARRSRRRAATTTWAYCAFDNDYAEFPTNTPLENLRVTAAHEYLPRRPVRLRLRRGRLVPGGHRHLGRGRGLRRRQRQPSSTSQTARCARPGRSMDQFSGLSALRRLDLLPLPHRAVPRGAGRTADPGPPACGSAPTDRRRGPTSTPCRPIAHALRSSGTSLRRRSPTSPPPTGARPHLRRGRRLPLRAARRQSKPLLALASAAQHRLAHQPLDHLASTTVRFTPSSSRRLGTGCGSSSTCPRAAGAGGVVTAYRNRARSQSPGVKLNSSGNGDQGRRASATPVSQRRGHAGQRRRPATAAGEGTTFSCQGTPRDDNLRLQGRSPRRSGSAS